VSGVARVDALQKRAEGRIFTVRGCQVILDSDLAEFYGVPTGRLNEQAKKNEARFPSDFRFQLTQEESEALLSENPRAKTGRGGRRNQPWAYTSKGALTAAGVLKTEQADAVAVAVARAFEAMASQLHQLSGVVERLERLETSTVSREELAGLRVEILNALKGLGGAVRDVQRRLPKQLNA
jgi:ORF6N domain-containing protein